MAEDVMAATDPHPLPAIALQRPDDVFIPS
jgi:hypothetical protein